MQFVEFRPGKQETAAGRPKALAILVAGATASFCALAALGAPAASAASLERSVTVSATPAEVWKMIGPFCAISDWLPPIGACSEDGKSPPTRTLVTKDGVAAFVETQTARNDQLHSYSYTFKSSPLAVAQYNSTIAVKADGHGNSIVTWYSTYIPDAGKEVEVREFLTGVYQSGLDSIKAKFAG